jgi:ABC-type transporter Mla subunit MlaD
MSDQARYVRVGGFVLAGLAMALGVVLLLGAGSLLERPIVVETVFDESVQGLQIGSAVKLRGVKIGSVSEIGFVGDFYDVSQSADPITTANRVLVRMEIVMKNQPAESADRETGLAALIARGLRVQLTPLGITGTSIIQADYLDPKRYPPIEVTWQPEHLYVPSAPSTITQLSSAADRLMTRINQLDVERLLTNLDVLLVNVNQVVTRADVEGVQRSLGALLDDARQTSAEVRSAVKQAGVGELNAEARKSIAQLNATLGRLQQLVDVGGEDLGTAFENFRVASENLRDASETARSYPSLLLFGEPPAPKPVQTPETPR